VTFPVTPTTLGWPISSSKVRRLACTWNLVGNVLVDVSLQKLGEITGFVAAERIVIVISVLIFFWGAFALIGAAAMDLLRGLHELLFVDWSGLFCSGEAL